MGIGLGYGKHIRSGTTIEEGVYLPWRRVKEEIAVEVNSYSLARRVRNCITRLPLNLFATKLLWMEDDFVVYVDLYVRVRVRLYLHNLSRDPMSRSLRFRTNGEDHKGG